MPHVSAASRPPAILERGSGGQPNLALVWTGSVRPGGCLPTPAQGNPGWPCAPPRVRRSPLEECLLETINQVELAPCHVLAAPTRAWPSAAGAAQGGLHPGLPRPAPRGSEGRAEGCRALGAPPGPSPAPRGGQGCQLRVLWKPWPCRALHKAPFGGQWPSAGGPGLPAPRSEGLLFGYLGLFCVEMTQLSVPCLSPPAPRPLPPSCPGCSGLADWHDVHRRDARPRPRSRPACKPRLLTRPAWSAAHLRVPPTASAWGLGGPLGAGGKGRGAWPWVLFSSLHPSRTPWPQPARCPGLLPSLPDLNSLVLIPWHPLPGRGHHGGGRRLLGDGRAPCVLCAGEGHPPASQRTCCHSD